ncbi:MAG: methyltransferase domain-containing protein [Candidatus Binatia bacterium]
MTTDDKRRDAPRAVGQTWDPDGYARNARFVSELGMPVVELLAPRPGERVLDLGCGDGALSRTLVEMGCEVVGVDSSEPQADAARRAGIDARVHDARRLPFDSEFDAVFSNAVLHWVHPHEAVIASVVRVLVPGGRFVGEFGGSGCVACIVAALEAELTRRGIDPGPVNPWYFPDAGEYRRLLEIHGFVVDFIKLIPRPTPLPGDVSGWLETFAGCFANAVPEPERASFIADVRARLEPQLCDEDGRWTADYIRLRFAARLV